MSAVLKFLDSYKYYYILKIAPTIDTLRCNIDNKAIISVFRVQDVFPPDVLNDSGICLKFFDGENDYACLVFSDTENMFNTDGFRFTNTTNMNYALDLIDRGIKLSGKKKMKDVKKTRSYIVTSTSTTSSIKVELPNRILDEGWRNAMAQMEVVARFPDMA
jgi:hypothetical protein